MMARFIFLSFFMLVGALAPTKAQNNFPYPALPDSLRSVEQRATYLSEHYWDNFNFSDTLELANKEWQNRALSTSSIFWHVSTRK